MTTLFLTFGLMLLLITGMAVGVLAGRKPITGSCGGIQNLGLKGKCDVCGGDYEKCEESGVETDTRSAGVRAFNPDSPAERA